MKFVGLFTIIYGGLVCLSIIGAIIGIPLIIAGLRLREAADSFEVYSKSNDTATLRKGFEQQGRFFFIQKIIIIVGLVLMALYILFFITTFGTLMNSL